MVWGEWYEQESSIASEVHGGGSNRTEWTQANMVGNLQIQQGSSSSFQYETEGVSKQWVDLEFGSSLIQSE